MMKSKISRQKEEELQQGGGGQPLDIEAILQERYKEESVSRLVVSQPQSAVVGKQGSGKRESVANDRKSPTVRREKSTANRPPSAANRQPSSQKAAAPPPRTVQTKTARVAGVGATGRKRNVIRVSVDFPVGLYEAVVAASNEEEQTIREFILGLVRSRFAG